MGTSWKDPIVRDRFKPYLPRTHRKKYRNRSLAKLSFLNLCRWRLRFCVLQPWPDPLTRFRSRWVRHPSYETRARSRCDRPVVLFFLSCAIKVKCCSCRCQYMWLKSQRVSFGNGPDTFRLLVHELESHFRGPRSTFVLASFNALHLTDATSCEWCSSDVRCRHNLVRVKI